MILPEQGGYWATESHQGLLVFTNPRWLERTTALLPNSLVGWLGFVLIICVCVLFVQGSKSSSRYSMSESRAYAIWSTETGLGVGNENLISKIIIPRLE